MDKAKLEEHILNCSACRIERENTSYNVSKCIEQTNKPNDLDVCPDCNSINHLHWCRHCRRITKRLDVFVKLHYKYEKLCKKLKILKFWV